MNSQEIIKLLPIEGEAAARSRKYIEGDDVMNDEEIVDLFLLRSEKAIDGSKKKYGRRLRQIAKAITMDFQTAEEVENDTYFRAWESIPPGKPYAYLYAFLARIARNLSLDFCKSRGRLKRSGDILELSEEMEQCIPSNSSTEEEADSIMLAGKISEFLNSKSEEKRNIFMRRYWFTDPVERISERYGISESKVKTTLFRLRAELKSYLESEGYTL